MSTVWNRLIRFVGVDNVIYFGEPLGIDEDNTVNTLFENDALEANVIAGDVFSLSAVLTDKVVKVAQILSPLSVEQVPIIKCIGLNYRGHIAESGCAPPPYPSVFIKPKHALANAFEDIPITKIAHDTLDFEGELAIVIGKTGKDISVSEAAQYIAGYTVCNDLSNRMWQKDPKFAGGLPQWCFSKGFDKFAPIGPVIVSVKVLGDRPELNLTTKCNDIVRQSANTSDLLFQVPEIVSFISQGTTLEKGTIILTGTPSGVCMGMKIPKYMQHGDLIDIEIQGIGKISNRMLFAN